VTASSCAHPHVFYQYTPNTLRSLSLLECCTFPFSPPPSSPLLRSSGLSLNHCSVRLVLAVGRSTLCCFSFFTLYFGLATTSDSNPSSFLTSDRQKRTHERLNYCSVLPIPPVFGCPGFIRPYVPLISSRLCIPVRRPVSFHRCHRYIGYWANRSH
jgi:hypothetical protein